MKFISCVEKREMYISSQVNMYYCRILYMTAWRYKYLTNERKTKFVSPSGHVINYDE